MRTLIIGDIHGCYEELKELLVAFMPQKGDDIIVAGDVIGRGPDPLGCLRILADFEAKAVLGNHEYWLLEHLKEGFDESALIGCNKHDLLYLKSFLPYIEREKFVVVHAGLKPNIALNDQNIEDLVNLRYLDNESGNKRPWFIDYNGKKRVYFGHWAALGFYHDRRVTCLDGGCVYGKHLLGYSLEEQKLYSVKAKKAYQPIVYHANKC